MTEDDVRRIVREELRAAFPDRQRVGGLDRIMPVQLPMPPYRYQTPDNNTCVYGSSADTVELIDAVTHGSLRARFIRMESETHVPD